MRCISLQIKLTNCLREKKEKRRKTELANLNKFGLSADLMIDYRRSTRTRKEVNYNYDDFDKKINDAVKLQNKGKKVVAEITKEYTKDEEESGSESGMGGGRHRNNKRGVEDVSHNRSLRNTRGRFAEEGELMGKLLLLYTLCAVYLTCLSTFSIIVNLALPSNYRDRRVDSKPNYVEDIGEEDLEYVANADVEVEDS